MTTILDCLGHWAKVQPEKKLFTFLDGAGNVREEYSYDSFLTRTRRLAGFLSEEAGLRHGDRVMLVYPPGLEMIVALFACVRLGVIPVPVHAPTSTAIQAGFSRIDLIVGDSGATVVLTSSEYLSLVEQTQDPRTFAAAHPSFAGLRWICTDTAGAGGPAPASDEPHAILLLQYTSGSTGDPKGVMITHRSVLHNARTAVQHSPVGVSWLPQYHDMGLIGHYLFNVVLGGWNCGFSPLDFLKRPVLWLRTISKVRATITSAPNYGFEYCLREDKVRDADLEGLDLSSLHQMMSAAEPVRPDTFTRFFERFSRYGLKRDAYVVGYGLAENTLGVTLRGRRILTINKECLQQRQLHLEEHQPQNNNQLRLVSCGTPLPETVVRIVDPDSGVAQPENTIGEIWVDGASKSAGYWQKPELTQAVFGARIGGEPERPNSYLRTGDLGFLHEGELYVCGRLKDMIIIRGVNYYPQDIEAVVERSFPQIAKGGLGRTAAFGVDGGDGEQLVLAVEIRNRQSLPDPNAIARAIRAHYFIEPRQILFVAPRGISRTTSGKISRGKTRQRWLRGELPVVATHTVARASSPAPAGLRDCLSRLLALYNLTGEETVTLGQVGIDSLTMVELILEIQKSLENRGGTDLASRVDSGFLHAIRISDVMTLIDAYEDGSARASRELDRFLAGLQQQDRDEASLMKTDAHFAVPKDAITPPATRPKQIFLTGATGFFGPFLLASLLERTAGTIHVLVRANDEALGQSRLVAALRRSQLWSAELAGTFQSRVRVVCGDLALVRLGLAAEPWQALADEIEAIVHAGATVNYVLGYRSLRSPNVLGTHELLRLACTRRLKPFHLVSSTFIYGWSTKAILWESDCNPEMEDLDFGYAQSKWAAEQAVLDAARQELPVRIYRPSLISASSRCVASRDDIAVRLLAFMIKNRLAVDAANQISFLPADLVANHVAALFAADLSNGPTFHVTSERYYNLIDVTRSITAQFGHPFCYVSVPEFIEKMNQLCTRADPLFPLLAFFNRSYRRIEAMRHKRYDNQQYSAALGNLQGVIAQPSLEEIVSCIVRSMIQEGLIPKKP